MEKLWKKLINKETILYLVFGILTTVINIAVCRLLADILKWDKVKKKPQYFRKNRVDKQNNQIAQFKRL